jgi:two-component system OmpR family response regulator
MKLFGKWRKDSDSSEAASFAAGDASQAIEDSDGAPIGKGRKILVVDDNAVVLKSFELKLKSLGFQVFTAGDGSAAVSTARQERPDLIVLDINFPPEVGSTGLQWDGFNIMEWMGRFKEVADIPVMIMTSGDPEKYRDRSLAAGAVAFFSKPINHEEFLVAVRRVLGQQGSAKPQAA